MIKIEKTKVVGLEQAVRGMRNPLNSWEKSDSAYCTLNIYDSCKNCPVFYGSEEAQSSDCKSGFCDEDSTGYVIGPNDLDLMMRLAAAGPVHAKYRRMIVVYMDIIAPLYWWKEFDTYKVGTVANSCSTMHKIHEKAFTLDDFSWEHLLGPECIHPDDELAKNCGLYACEISPDEEATLNILDDYENVNFFMWPEHMLMATIKMLNECRIAYLKTKDKRYWWQMIQLLPSSYNQKRTVMLNYEVLHNIYISRKDHKLDEWRDFCEWIYELPYPEVITIGS